MQRTHFIPAVQIQHILHFTIIHPLYEKASLLNKKKSWVAYLWIRVYLRIYGFFVAFLLYFSTPIDHDTSSISFE